MEPIFVAEVVNGVVVAVTLEGDGAALRSGQVIVGPVNNVGIGWRWDGTAFSAPPEAVPSCEG